LQAKSTGTISLRGNKAALTERRLSRQSRTIQKQNGKQGRGPKPAPSVGAQSSFLRSIAHDLHVAVRIVASFDHASVREPNESRCGGNECAFVEDRVISRALRHSPSTTAIALSSIMGGFDIASTPERINDRTAGSSVSRE
jgi:hypothetical protein